MRNLYVITHEGAETKRRFATRVHAAVEEIVEDDLHRNRTVRCLSSTAHLDESAPGPGER